MKIAIDVSQIIYGTGVSVYTKNLIRYLLKIDKDNDYILFGGSLRRRQELHSILNSFESERVKTSIFPFPQTIADVIWNKLHILSVEKLIGKIDVLHSSDWTQPPSKAFKVTTIHDLVPVKYPKLSDPKLVKTHGSRFKRVIKEADRIIVPSLATARDVERMGILRDRIRVIPEAVDPIFKPAKKWEVNKIKKKYRISDKFLIAVGVNPRKNIQRVIDAYEKIKSDEHLKLVVIGHPFLKIDIPRGVRFLGHIDTSELPVLYTAAEALVYPSLYEGFGLPILEAFSCKLPVITTNSGSMAEVGGRAAVLVNPYDTDAIADGIRKALKDKKILENKGLNRAMDFSWEKTAKQTLQVYKEYIV